MIHELRQRRLADFIAAILAAGDRASHWAEHCGWVPGNGYCSRARRKSCQDACFFRWMRDEEAIAIRRERTRRRRVRQASYILLLGYDLAQTYCLELPIAG